MIDLTNKDNMSKVRYECRDKVTEYLKSFNFTIEKSRSTYQKAEYEITSDNVINKMVIVDKTLSPTTQKLRYGDILLKFKDYLSFNIDIRYGTFISEKSIDQFKGNYYILTPKGDISEEGIKNAMVIKSLTIKSYFQPVQKERMTKVPSGTLGYRFNKIKNYIRLEDFVLELTKILLSSNISQGMEDLQFKFNKVKGTRIPYKEHPGRYRRFK